MGGVGNGAAEEDWCWDLNPGTAAIPERTIRLWWSRLGSRDFGVFAFATWLWRRRERGLRSFGRVRTLWGNTADGAGSLNHRLLLLFLRYGTPDWAQGEGRTVCICGCSKGLCNLNEDIKLLLLSLYNSLNNSFPFHQPLALRDIFPWQ